LRQLQGFVKRSPSCLENFVAIRKGADGKKYRARKREPSASILILRVVRVGMETRTKAELGMTRRRIKNDDELYKMEGT